MSLKEIPEIIKQFDSKQRLVVLILILVFISLTTISITWLKGSDCSAVIKQNKELVNDYVQIVDILRKQVGEENKDLVFGDNEAAPGNESSGQVDSMMVSTPPAESEPDRAPASSSGIEEDNTIALKQVLKIAKKHTNNEQN
jgi:hypothetical protein